MIITGIGTASVSSSPQLTIKKSVESPMPGQPFGVAVCAADGSEATASACNALASGPMAVEVEMNVWTASSAASGPTTSANTCKLLVGEPIAQAFNKCRFTAPTAAVSYAALTACPLSSPTGSIGGSNRRMLLQAEPSMACASTTLSINALET
eukprot:scaffold298577_cov35-Prasinocladus_malaysianus.AAC.1